MGFPYTFPFYFEDIETDLLSHQADSDYTPYVKLVLSKSGETTYTYYATDRVLRAYTLQTPYNDEGEIHLDNSDKALTSIDFEGYKAMLDFGLVIGGEAKSVSQPPLWVTNQMMQSEEGVLKCILRLRGTLSLLHEDHASGEFEGSGTAKSIVNRMLSASLPIYNHCESRTVEWRGDTGLGSINLYSPSSYYYVGLSDSRHSAVRRLLDMSNSFMRVGSDEKIYIEVPVTSGDTYAHSFSLAAHIFHRHNKKNRVIIPNKITVTSVYFDSEGVVQGEFEVSGSATHSDSYDILPFEYFIRVGGLTTEAQCQSMAQGVLNGIIASADLGYVEVPPNFYIKLMDYVQVTDSRMNDTVSANVGSIEWFYESGLFRQVLHFGSFAGRFSLTSMVRQYEDEEGSFYFPYWNTVSCPITYLASGEYLVMGIYMVPKFRTFHIKDYVIWGTDSNCRLLVVQWDADPLGWVVLHTDSPTAGYKYYRGEPIDLYDSYTVGGFPIAVIAYNDSEEAQYMSAALNFDIQFSPGGLP